MTPIQNFREVWARCNELESIHTKLQAQSPSTQTLDELLRAEWVARVSALDLYIHEKVIQGMVETFQGVRPTTDAYLRFQLSNELVQRILTAPDDISKAQAYDLEVRTKLGFVSYQDPEKIADGIRMISSVELWNGIALNQGATEATKSAEAKKLKRGLSLIVDRRNKIAHEGDLQPNQPRVPWLIDRTDVAGVKSYIENLVNSIESIT